MEKPEKLVEGYVCLSGGYEGLTKERSRRVNRRSGVTSKRGDRSKRDDREGGGGGGGGGDKGMISKDVGRISGDTVDDSQGGLSGGGKKVYRQIRRLVTRQRMSE